MKNLYLPLSLIVFAVFAADAQATLSLGTILNDPALNNVIASDDSYISVDTESKAGKRMKVSIRNENAGFAATNEFGIFDYSDPSNKLMIFDGKDSPRRSIQVTFDFDNNLAWTKPKHKVAIGSTFGFYLDSTATENMEGGLFYSDPLLNTGADYGIAKSLLFDTADVTGITGHPELVVAFEDLSIGATNYLYDGDFNDMVVGLSFSGTTVVPEPATIALLGIGYVVFFSKKRF